MSVHESRSQDEDSAGRQDEWAQAERLGIDMTLVEANLRLTPLERIRQSLESGLRDRQMIGDPGASMP